MQMWMVQLLWNKPQNRLNEYIKSYEKTKIGVLWGKEKIDRIKEI